MDVFRLGRLPPEELAALLASWSRSPDSLRNHARGLLGEGLLSAVPLTPESSGTDDDVLLARQERLAAYGHDSVGEHAVLHLAVEGISLLCARSVLDSRLGSFIEKSGRFQPEEPDLIEPEELESPAARAAFSEATERLHEARLALAAPLLETCRAAHPRDDAESEVAWERRIDGLRRNLLRQLIPLATRTDLAMTVNARGLRLALDKLRSTGVREERDLSERLLEEGRAALPSLLEGRGQARYREDTRRAMASWADEVLGRATGIGGDRNRAKLVRTPEAIDERLVTAILFRHSSHPHSAVRTRVAELDADTRAAVLEDYLRRRGPHDDPLRDLEHVAYTFEVVLDGVALREVQRHRLATRTPQPLGVAHGYLRDPEILAADPDGRFVAAMEGAREAFVVLRELAPAAAPYVLPLGYRQRTLQTWNLRALHHFIQLRSSRKGNRSVRHVAQDMFREVERVHPTVARTMRVSLDREDEPGGR